METRKAGPLRFDIGGMHCAACSSRIERVVGRMENVERIAVNLATAKAQIWLKPGTEKETVPLIMERVAGMGFSAVPSQEEDVAVQYEKKRRHMLACPCPPGSTRTTRPAPSCWRSWP